MQVQREKRALVRRRTKPQNSLFEETRGGGLGGVKDTAVLPSTNASIPRRPPGPVSLQPELFGAPPRRGRLAAGRVLRRARPRHPPAAGLPSAVRRARPPSGAGGR